MRAARLVLESIREYVGAGRSFALESTLSGRTYARMIPEWKRAGYYVTLFFWSTIGGTMRTRGLRPG